MNVHIRQRKREKTGKITLVLEIYKGYTKNENGTVKANRVNQKLDYFLHENPKTPSEKAHNKDALKKAEAIKGEVLKDLLNGKYGFKSETKVKANFIEYFRKLTNERLESKGNYGNWDSVLKHLIKYRGEAVSFEGIDVDYCEGFKEYLCKIAKTSSHQPLSSSSISSYYCKLRAALNSAVDDGIILSNPSLKVPTPRIIEHAREFLTVDEVKQLFKAECRYDILKRAFLFSCLTGMRWIDVQSLKWSQIQKEGKDWKVVFHQKKTKGLEYHYINEQAKELMGEKNEGEERVFVGLKYSSYMNVALAQWMLRAGVTKHITFHCGRHTYATLMLTQGVDLYTVSKLLGHKEIKTTQIYARVIDEKKKDAVNKLPNFLID